MFLSLFLKYEPGWKMLLTFSSLCPSVLQVHLGSVELQPAPDPLELNRGMIAHTLKCNMDLMLDNCKLLEENGRLKRQHQTILRE